MPRRCTRVHPPSHCCRLRRGCFPCGRPGRLGRDRRNRRRADRARLARCRFQCEKSTAPVRRRRRRSACTRRRPGESRRHPRAPGRDGDPGQFGDHHQGSHRAVRAQGTSRRGTRRRGQRPDAKATRGQDQRPGRAGGFGQRAQAVRITAHRRGSARRISCNSGSSSCRSKSRD